MGMKKRMYSRSSGRFALPQFQMLGYVLLVWGGYMAYQGSLWSMLVLFLGFALASASMGVQIDFHRKNQREYISVFGIRVGQWKTIPDLDYVSVYKENYKQAMGMLSITSDNSFQKFKIKLVAKEDEHMEAGLFNSKEEAMTQARSIATELEAKLLDYTDKEAQWVELDTT